MPRKAFQVSFDNAPAEPEFHASVEKIEVDESAMSSSTFALRVGVKRDASGEWPTIEDQRFSLYTKVSIEAGVLAAPSSPGGLEPIFEGYVTEARVHIGAQAGEASIEIRGMDPLVLLSLEEKTVAWPNVADSDIATQIVSAYGLPIRATATSPVRQDNETLILQRGTDAQFLRVLARRNGFELCFTKDRGGPSTCYFGPPRVNGAPQPDLAVQFGEAGNLAWFDASTSGLRPLAVNATQLDARTKQDSAVDVSSSQLRSLGANGLDALVLGKLDSLVTPHDAQARLLLLAQPSADQSELRTVAQAVRDEAEWLVSARGEINTDAYAGVLRPGALVLVKGAGRQQSGTYYVTRVRHVIKADGSHVQTFDARRNARDLSGSERFSDPTALGVAVPEL